MSINWVGAWRNGEKSVQTIKETKVGEEVFTGATKQISINEKDHPKTFAALEAVFEAAASEVEGA